MKRIMIAALALLALGAVFAVGAEAKTKPITGPAPYTASSGLSKLSSEGLPEIECKKSKAAGQLTSATHGEVTVTFEECETNGKKCGNISPGTIETKLLETTVGWISKAKGEVGVDFIGKAGGTTGKGAEAEFECEGLAVSVKGSAIGKSVPLNVMATTGEVVLNGAGGKQEVEKLEGQPKDTLITEANILPGSELPSAQDQTGKETFSPIIETKGKKKITREDKIELNTVNNPAQPEQGRCVAAKKAKYSDSNCTTEAPLKKGKKTGKFEFVAI
ncbi:MAG TPA: hypothetical protein VNV44_00750 [Solirubrobacteraceae bacterium]|jgi:hypothetical protein|nr:hypothetical protein [Solirubrobacteraceae bacterium]